MNSFDELKPYNEVSMIDIIVVLHYSNIENKLLFHVQRSLNVQTVEKRTQVETFMKNCVFSFPNSSY